MPIQTHSTLILEPDNYSSDALAIYGRLGNVWLGHAPEKAAVSLLVVRLGRVIDAELLDEFPSLRAIASPTTGLNHIDLVECERRDIHVFSLADCRDAISKVTSTSELALGLMIALLRNIPLAAEDVSRRGNWNRDVFRSRQLSRLTLGIIGIGRLGGHMCGYARALEMKVLAYDPYQNEERFDELGASRMDLIPLLQAADIVTVHASLRDDNRNLLSTREIGAMRPHALLVNTARGGLVDEHAVASALQERRLGGYAADVLADEHKEPRWLENSPVFQAAARGLNVLLTPHIGGCTTDAMHLTEERLAGVVYDCMEG
ncbi:NAD(P)-dependent oxidoreductase [Rhizobium laguerreae]|uniref:NAD(P)-dependent oxidoreductase n=1 Tax=Rhizobium laguerreae TaxID=1076926 RepID=UPI001C909341|nr:NAD(P)-dependent oxidoreductase [Rhizobium laguerreae]MBY3363418.1 hypothetical protein [Rhizobium laguerreae]